MNKLPMTPKKRVQAAMHGERPDRIPFIIYESMIPRCTSERELRNRGLCVLRGCSSYKLVSPNVKTIQYHYTDEKNANLIRTVYSTPVGVLYKIDQLGYFSSWTQEFIFKSTDDYKVLLSMRGTDNWSRNVRMVCWSDNTEGNLLLACETCTPSGNWSTIPPHRHQYKTPEWKRPMKRLTFLIFASKWMGLIWTIDDGDLNQAYSVKNNDIAYNRKGYHPVVCVPSTMLYHLTFMAGPRRICLSRIHEGYKYIMDEKKMENQYWPEIKQNNLK